MTAQEFAEKKYEAGKTFGNYSDIEGFRNTLDRGKLNGLASRIIGDSSHYFRAVSSFQNPQRRVLEDDSFKFVIPFSGGHDSGITLELLARSHMDRLKEGKGSDQDEVVAYSCQFGVEQPDETFNKSYIENLQKRYPNLPLVHRVIDIEGLNSEISSGLEQILEEGVGYPWFTSVVLASLASEYTEYLGIDSSNLTESLIAEISNGCVGLNPVSPLGTIPKSVLFKMSDQMGITQYLPCADSLLPRDETKASKYFTNAPSTIDALKDSFSVIDSAVITYIENPKLNAQEVSQVIGISPQITQGIINRVKMASKTQSPFYMGGKNDLSTEMSNRESREWRRGFYEGPYRDDIVKIFNGGNN